jgi:hypothetical protein
MNSATHNTDRNHFARHCLVVKPGAVFFGPRRETPHCNSAVALNGLRGSFREEGAHGLPFSGLPPRGPKHQRMVRVEAADKRQAGNLSEGLQ